MNIKQISFVISFLVVFALSVFAQCETEPTIEKTGKILVQKKLSLKSANLVNLNIEANAEGTSWATKGAESDALTIFVDGKYNQDILLFAGAEKFNYQILLGQLDAGNHLVSIVLNKSHSVKQTAKVFSITPQFYSLTDKKIPAVNYFALANAPFIYLRPNVVDKFSDIPLVTYYEVFDEPESVTKITYTTIFTNEDGGTQSTALLARWGRMTDIEWIYEFKWKDGKIVSETYQAANHQTKNYQGARIFGANPLIFDVTDNNNFADKGCSALRVLPLPVRADLSGGSRETVMDKLNWTYKIMAQEAMREGRVDPKNLGVNVIDDLRNYLFVETYSENEKSTIAVEVETRDGKKSRSDFGDARLRIDRKGYQRIAVRLPFPKAEIQSVSLVCEAAAKESPGNCANARIVKFVSLDEKFGPILIVNDDLKGNTIVGGQKVSWQMPRK